ncbi:MULTISPECIES: excalibur calcium-binding domain-containing protein [Bacillus cereus group]|uniref:excalibur calcium-binding domain-containing protein n=1 Tax=Bacillus cereus group TaxID=86661 RepID=UPI0022E29A38|nr:MULTISPECIES: excalibur calcium-binding domain-containing protein [unclassified Bacillus cereus group]HDR7718263.1 excalibur calcium-binding domain-containing protein [Bacillus albus]MDA2026702.1 excalibur calcium-binding domain-containing protein [Bacillus cereus group sp. Bcc03]MDA2261327.1 excalibur calcium-binding domain-containing protein [Bacillus cereus group sp. Bc200]MDA2322006.1 excalibur calcium-binding domain-containing protein [Bacillus cereus group sp. Bc177]MDA2713401.1 excal
MFNVLTFLFLLLSVLAIIALIIGLIKPGKVIRFGNKKTRGLVILIFLPVLFISFILAGVFANKSMTPEQQAAIDKKSADEKVLKEKQEQEKNEKEKDKKAEEQEKKEKEKEDQEIKAQEEKKAAEEKRRQEEAQKQEEQRKLAEAQKQEESTSKSTINNSGASESFSNCTELRKKYPNGVPSSHPAYSAKLDRDKDGFACEKN